MDFELGMHLGNAHPDATAGDVLALAADAEQLGFDAVWMTEHVVVAADEAHRYANVVHPIPALAYLAASTARVKLGTSVIVAPMHDPFLLAKLAAGIQDLAPGRLRLGLGAGWYAPEFALLGRPFDRRGRRLDEAVALMRALWAGERTFEGEFWQMADGHFGPLPAVAPEIWIGGGSRHAARRAARLGAVWHPIGIGAAEIASAKSEWPGLRIVPRITADDAKTLLAATEAVREAGAEGVAAGLTTAPARNREAFAAYRAGFSG